MAKFWRRKAQEDTHNAQPAHNTQPAALPADLAAWAREADVSRLSSQTVREAEDYLNKYRHMNLDLSQQMGWRVIAAIEAQVTPSPPPFAQPLDVIATVLALRRKQPGTGLSSPPALVLPSLGYEASGSGLRRLGRSPLCHLTSASVWEVVVYGALHLSRLSRARRISFTDWFTGVQGSPRARAGKILPRPRRTVGGEKARLEPYKGGARARALAWTVLQARRPGARRLGAGDVDAPHAV